MTGQYGKWLGKHVVQYYEKTREILKYNGNIGVTTRYGKWKNV